MDKSDKFYDSPRVVIMCIQLEGALCWSCIEELGENEGDWGW